MKLHNRAYTSVQKPYVKRNNIQAVVKTSQRRKMELLIEMKIALFFYELIFFEVKWWLLFVHFLVVKITIGLTFGSCKCHKQKPLFYEYIIDFER